MLQITDKTDLILKNKAKQLKMLNDPCKKKYIMGINKFADDLLLIFKRESITIDGIIDTLSDDEKYKGIPIVDLEYIEKDALIISCVFYGRLVTAIKNLRANGFANIINYLELVIFDRHIYPDVNFSVNNKIDIDNNISHYNWLYEHLEDESSKNILFKILDFRYNYNIEAMIDFHFNLEKQYFDGIVVFGPDEVFVDCGGYDGSTTKEFIKINSNYKRVYYFEPSSTNFQISIDNIGENPNIKMFNKATYSKNCKLKFESSNGPESSFSDEGSEWVDAVRLDDVIKEKVSYIKIDVEGAELDTLIGAQRIIMNDRPKLAVCVYHDQQDFWRIPMQILKYNPKYKIYLRHYTEGLLETVMYFV